MAAADGSEFGHISSTLRPLHDNDHRVSDGSQAGPYPAGMERPVLFVSSEFYRKCEIRTETLVTRDRLLIPLNVCRKGTFYMPWECENERHSYEKCAFPCYLFRQLTPDCPCAQVPVRRVSLAWATGLLRAANHDFLQLYASHEGTLQEKACRV